MLVLFVLCVRQQSCPWTHVYCLAQVIFSLLIVMQDVIFGLLAPQAQQQAGSPRCTAEAAQESPPPKQPSPLVAQSSPPNLPSPLPLRSPGSASPSNMPLDHLLMLANMTNNQPGEEWNASPSCGNLPSMQGAGDNFYPAYSRALYPSPPYPFASLASARPRAS